MTTPDADTLLADTLAFNAELERRLATIPPVNTVPPEESRRARREGRGIFPPPVYVPEARVVEIDGPGRADRAAGHRPRRPSRGERSCTSTAAAGRSARPTGRTPGYSGWRAIPG